MPDADFILSFDQTTKGEVTLPNRSGMVATLRIETRVKVPFKILDDVIDGLTDMSLKGRANLYLLLKDNTPDITPGIGLVMLQAACGLLLEDDDAARDQAEQNSGT